MFHVGGGEYVCLVPPSDLILQQAGRSVFALDLASSLKLRRPCSRRSTRLSGCRRRRAEWSRLPQALSWQESLISLRSHASRARQAFGWNVWPRKPDILALKYPAFAGHLAQRLLKGSIFENRTQLCLSVGPDPPNAAGCRRSDGSYSARHMKAAGFSMTCQKGGRSAKARIAF